MLLEVGSRMVKNVLLGCVRVELWCKHSKYNFYLHIDCCRTNGKNLRIYLKIM